MPGCQHFVAGLVRLVRRPCVHVNPFSRPEKQEVLSRALCLPQHLATHFHSSAGASTDGVYHELTSQRVKTPWIEALRKKREECRENSPSSKPIAKPLDRTPKKMSDSYHSVVLPFSSDPWILDNYLNVDGNIRLGSLFMDLDALAGVISYKHTGDSVMTVTAAVDRITINHPLRELELCDLELSGHVSFATGRSSMVQVAKAAVEGAKSKPEDVLLTCAFTMVSLDPRSKRPVSISPLQIDSPAEQNLFDLGQKNYEAKKDLSKTSLRKMTPNDEESDLIHSMWLKYLGYVDPQNALAKPENTHYMGKTSIHSSLLMQPQYRNRHNFMIFGGLLLKQTFELAFCCVASFSQSRPEFVSLDPSTFENPVPVGSVLYLTATVAYTDEPPASSQSHIRQDSKNRLTRVQVRVDSKVRNIEHGETKPTGQFNYTFIVEADINVMPNTYSEYMIWLDARRRAQRVTASLMATE